ncbi:AAA family ATPase [Halobacillus sp. HZG1]|uniref:AAA family ATPase n=1 Tax=Halobacillus sp. HZG1 TaxID=3111769 RepID=UPI002DBA7C5A|nr:AAA family ATPase [Halobacillus sp. HZG1]MEC3884950.1 AAA family ATPase [Halobacillus sp. HZG1]
MCKVFHGEQCGWFWENHILTTLEKEGFVRLSIDEEIWTANGRYGIDFPVEKLDAYKIEAERKLQHRLIKLIHDKQPVVIDFSFWNRARWDQYKKRMEYCGRRWKLIYLKVHPDDLRERLKLRNKRFDANSFPIFEELLSSYLKGFEIPNGEGEIGIENQIHPLAQLVYIPLYLEAEFSREKGR